MRVLTLLCLTLCATLSALAPAEGKSYDLILRNGRVIDGTGNPAFFADVGIHQGRIAAIGRIREKARREIDVAGMVVAPGFIDVHTHAENVASLPRAENFVRMGVTTIVTGNCGGSALEVAPFLRRIRETRVSINVATLIGHNTVRTAAMGGSFDRAPTDAELATMKALVERAMKDGAVGLSTGLIYLPGTFARTEEIIELAKVAAAYDGIYASHMRNEAAGILEALQELFRIAREARIRADVSHIKQPVSGSADAVLAAIEGARAGGLDITHDQYVYTASSTGIGTLIPAAAREGGAERFRARIADPAEKARIVAQMKERLQRAGREDYGYAVIASYATDRSLNGKNIVEAAKLKRGSDSLDDQIELILEIQRSGGASGIFHGIGEENLQRFLQHPNTMIASDSGVRRIDASVPHPRGYGNNARVLARYVRELKLLRLEDAIRRMTSLPATTYRLPDRGLLRERCWADIVVFDPNTVQDAATFSDPHHYATGIPYVFVNGVAVVQDGAHTDARPGKALRHTANR
jgi:N-acyl-D-amino-acid deacylase